MDDSASRDGDGAEPRHVTLAFGGSCTLRSNNITGSHRKPRRSLPRLRGLLKMTGMFPLPATVLLLLRDGGTRANLNQRDTLGFRYTASQTGTELSEVQQKAFWTFACDPVGCCCVNICSWYIRLSGRWRREGRSSPSTPASGCCLHLRRHSGLFGEFCQGCRLVSVTRFRDGIIYSLRPFPSLRVTFTSIQPSRVIWFS